MKFHVTPELATLIKTLRSQNKVSAKDLAEHVDRSRSYISKLEGGAIQTIQKEDLTKILSFITDGNDFYNEKLIEIVRVLRSFMDPTRMNQQLWLIQYDCAERQIPVTEGLLNYFKTTLKELRVTPWHLAELVNANIDSELSDQLPSNEYLDLSYQRGSHMLVIRMEISEEELVEIVGKQRSTATYSVLFSLVFTLEKVREYPEMEPLIPDDARKVLRRASAILDGAQVHCLTDYGTMVNSVELLAGQEELYNSFDAIDPGIISNILYRFGELMDYDTNGTVDALKIFSDSLQWDPAFVMQILRIPFRDLEGMSYSNKKKMLTELQDVFDTYASMSALERKIEEY